MPSTCLDSASTPHPKFCCTAPGTYTYTIFVTDGNGCTNSATTTVTVNPLPIITASPPVSVCSGQSVQLSATGGVTYSWSSSASCTTPGTCTYTVFGTDANGCTD